METRISEKTVVVTGATSGIGLAVAEELVRSGASVIGIGRSAERCAAAQAGLHRLNPEPWVAYLTADLSVQGEVRGLGNQVRDLLDTWNRQALDGLVNNAGTFSYWLTLTADGVELQWAVNHLAAFLLTNTLLPMLQAAPLARVVTVSSGSHYNARLDWNDLQLRRHYNGLQAYGNTKLANILFTREMNRRLGEESTVRAFAADPGLVKTDIGMKGTPGIVSWVWKLRRSGGITAAEAARGICYLLTEPSIQDVPSSYWKHGQPKAASHEAQNCLNAARLWKISSQMCGLPVEECYANA